MPFRRKHPQDSAVQMIIVALLIGVMVGFASGWETSALQQRRAANVPAAPSPSPALRPEPPGQAPAEMPTLVPANPVVYRGVIDAVDGASLAVTVMEGAVGAPKVTLLADDATLVALRPAASSTSLPERQDTTRGLPKPPKPPANPYVQEPMALGSFRVGDVVEFSSGEPLRVGASIAVDKVTWIMNLEDQAAQPAGPVGDGGPAPLAPKR